MCSAQVRCEVKTKTTSHPDSVKLLYWGPATAHIRGSVTGRMYCFSNAAPVQRVDSRDAVLISQYRFLRQVQ
jgi:hypothetical protein